MSCYAEFEADNNYFDFREDSLSIASSTGYSVVDSAGNSGAHSGGSSTDSRRESDVSNASGRRGSFVLDVYRHQGAQSSSVPSSSIPPGRKPSDDSASSCGGGATSGAQSSPRAMPHAPSIDSNTTVHSLSDLTIGHRQWNAEYQALADHWKNFPKKASLTEQFYETARLYGRLIVSERPLPNHLRTIKPVNIGGLSGGDKYVFNGILFKFATDVEVTQDKHGNPVFLYGGTAPNDEYAIKAASRELIGRSRYWNTHVKGLYYPLMCLIDCKGYRLLAMGILPIDKETIRYGSDDGGRTVHGDDPVLNRLMEQCGTRLNTAPHLVGIDPIQRRLIYGAGDVEGHLGHDGRYYLLDFARNAPPEAPRSDDKRAVFRNLLRPEFVKEYRLPLCADSFSRWDASPDARQHAANIREATEHLYHVIIPEFAKSLDDDFVELNLPLDVDDQLKAAGVHLMRRFEEMEESASLTGSTSSYTPSPTHVLLQLRRDLKNRKLKESHEDVYNMMSLLGQGMVTAPPNGARVVKLVQDQLECLNALVSSSAVHKAGINLRHLGRIRRAAKVEGVRVLILTACVARVMKHTFRSMMRTEMQRSQIPSDEPFKALACRYLGMVLNGFQGDERRTSRRARRFWRTTVKAELKRRFRHILLSHEAKPDFDLRRCVQYKLLMYMFLKLTGVVLTPKALGHVYKSRTTDFILNRNDVLDIETRVRCIFEHYISQGVTALLFGTEASEDQTARRMFGDAVKYFSEAYEMSSDGGLVSCLLATTLTQLACRKQQRSRRDSDWRRANMWWRRQEADWDARRALGIRIRCTKNFATRVSEDIGKLKQLLSLVQQHFPGTELVTSIGPTDDARLLAPILDKLSDFSDVLNDDMNTTRLFDPAKRRASVALSASTSSSIAPAMSSSHERGVAADANAFTAVHLLRRLIAHDQRLLNSTHQLIDDMKSRLKVMPALGKFDQRSESRRGDSRAAAQQKNRLGRLRAKTFSQAHVASSNAEWTALGQLFDAIDKAVDPNGELVLPTGDSALLSNRDELDVTLSDASAVFDEVLMSPPPTEDTTARYDMPNMVADDDDDVDGIDPLLISTTDEVKMLSSDSDLTSDPKSAEEVAARIAAAVYVDSATRPDTVSPRSSK